MKSTRHMIALAMIASLTAGFTLPAFAQDTIKIGELNSYKAQPAFLDPYKKGWQLALEEINAKGGVLGKKLEVISRDDGANPGDAVRVADELVTREGVAMLAGTFLSHIGLAVTEFRRQEEGVLPRRRTADRQDHLAERQQIHLPPARLDLHAGGDADAGRRWPPRRSAGRSSIRTSNTASRPRPTSRR